MATTAVNGKRGRGGLQVPTPPQGYLHFTSQSSQTVTSSLRLARSSLGGLARKGEMDGWMGGEWKDRALDGRRKNKMRVCTSTLLALQKNRTNGRRRERGGRREGTTHTTAIIIMTGPHPPRTALRAFRSGSRPSTRGKNPEERASEGNGQRRRKKERTKTRPRWSGEGARW